MKRTSLASIVALVAMWVVAMIPSAALGGGGTRLEWERNYYVVGDEASGSVASYGWEGSGTVADGPYRAYLVPTFDFKERPGIPKGAIDVGPATVTAGSEGRINVSVSFKIPDVASGLWYVRICNSGCQLMPGDLYDSGFTVAATAVEARWMERFDRLQTQMNRMVDGDKFREARGDLAALDKRVGGLATNVAGSEEQIAHLERNTFESVPWLMWLTVLIGVMATVFAVFALRTRRTLKALLGDPLVALHAEVAERPVVAEPRSPAGVS